MRNPPRPPGSTAGLWEIVDYLSATATFLNEAAVALLHGQEAQRMTQQASEKSLEDKLTAITQTLTGEGGVITTLQAGMAQLRQQLTDLQAQQTPVTAQQLQSLDSQAGAIQSTAASQLAELQTLATPPAPPAPNPAAGPTGP